MSNKENIEENISWIERKGFNIGLSTILYFVSRRLPLRSNTLKIIKEEITLFLKKQFKGTLNREKKKKKQMEELDGESFAGGDNQNDIDILIYNIYTRLKNISKGDFLNNIIIPEIKEIGKKCKIKKDTIEEIINNKEFKQLIINIQEILDKKESMILCTKKIRDIISNIHSLIITPIYNSLEDLRKKNLKKKFV